MEMERVLSTFILAAMKTAEKKKNVHTFQFKVLKLLPFLLIFDTRYEQRCYLTALASSEGHEHITVFLNEYCENKLVRMNTH